MRTLRRGRFCGERGPSAKHAGGARVQAHDPEKTELPDSKYVTLLVAVDIDPGTVVARHTHPGVESTYVAEGEFELTVKGQPAKTIKVGDGFQVPPETPHSARNGDKLTRLVVTYVVDKDKPLASPAPE